MEWAAILANAMPWLRSPGSMFQAFPEAMEHFLRDPRLVTMYMKQSGAGRLVADPLLHLKPTEIVQVLQDIGHVDEGFQWAARKGRTEVVRLLLLLDRITDFDQRTLNKALESAALNGHKNTVTLLLDHCLNLRDFNGRALRWAAHNGHVEVVRLLLNRGAYFYTLHAFDTIALCTSAENGHVETVALLLDRGADIHAADDFALRWAAENGHTSTVALLLGRGTTFDPYALNEALEKAATNSHAGAVALLEGAIKEACMRHAAL